MKCLLLRIVYSSFYPLLVGCVPLCPLYALLVAYLSGCVDHFDGKVLVLVFNDLGEGVFDGGVV